MRITQSEAIAKIEDIAQETGNRLTIVYDPHAHLWRVTVGAYQAESVTLLLALHAVIEKRATILRQS